MRRVSGCVLVVLLAASITSSQAHARGSATVGAIAGVVLDASGAPVPGALVVATSPTQIGGARSALTGRDGSFRILGLMPGTFAVQASADGHRRWQAPDVAVGIAATTVLDVWLGQGTEADEVDVVPAAARAVETSSAAIGASVTGGVLRDSPRAGDGIQTAAVLVAGARDPGAGDLEIGGGSRAHTTVSIDGFEVGNSLLGGTNLAVAPVALAGVDVRTAGYGVEGGTTQGGLVNVLTLSGGNRLQVDGRVTYSSSDLRFGPGRDEAGSDHLADASVGVGGAIIPNGLWYQITLRGTRATSRLGPDPAGILPDHPGLVRDRFAGSAKLTLQASGRQKLVGFAHLAPASTANAVQQYNVTAEAEAHRKEVDSLVGLAWEAIPRDDVFVRVQVGWLRLFESVAPESCQGNAACHDVPASLDLETGLLRGNYSLDRRETRNVGRIDADAEWFPAASALGKHALKLGLGADAFLAPMMSSVPGNRISSYLGASPYAQTAFCANDPRVDGGTCRGGSVETTISGWKGEVFLRDAWHPTRHLTITPGLALGMGLVRSDGSTATDLRALTPHAAVVWDATHDGRTALRGGFGQYVDTGSLAAGRFVGRGFFARTCFYDPATKTYDSQCQTTDNDNTIGRPSGADGPTTALRAPRVSEITAGAERELLPGTTAAVDAVYRKFEHGFEDIETNLIWNESGTALRPDGGYKDGRSHFVFDLETPDAARKRYEAVTLSLQKRRDRLQLLGSYTWARFEGPANEPLTSGHLDNPANAAYWYGPLPGDRRHTVKVNGRYAPTPWLTVGAGLSFATGEPYNRWFYNPVYQSFSDLRAPRGTDPRVVTNPDDDRRLRLPSTWLLDLRLRAGLARLVGAPVDLWVDLLGLTPTRSTTAVNEHDGPAFGQPIARLPPARARLGLDFRF